MPNVKRTESDRFIGESFQTKKGYIVRQAFPAPVAAAAANVLAAQTVAALVTSGITSPVTPSVLSIVGGGGTHTASGNVVITGTDVRGNVITDTIVLNSNTTVSGIRVFKTVTSVDLTGVSGIGAASTVSVGTTAKLGLNRICQEDSALLGAVDGVFEATRPVISFNATDISKNFVTFNTAPNGAKNFALFYGTAELTTAA